MLTPKRPDTRYLHNYERIGTESLTLDGAKGYLCSNKT